MNRDYLFFCVQKKATISFSSLLACVALALLFWLSALLRAFALALLCALQGLCALQEPSSFLLLACDSPPFLKKYFHICTIA